MSSCLSGTANSAAAEGVGRERLLHADRLRLGEHIGRGAPRKARRKQRQQQKQRGRHKLKKENLHGTQPLSVHITLFCNRIVIFMPQNVNN